MLWGENNTLDTFLEPALRGVKDEIGAVELGQHTLFKEYLLMMASVGIAALGIWLAYRLYLQYPKLHSKIAAAWPRLYDLLVHKYYVDEIYDALFVNRVKDLSTAFGVVDAKLIDGVAVDGAGWLARVFSRISMWWDNWVIDGLVNLAGKITRGLSVPVRMFQTGVFSSYAVLILLGLAILLGYYGHHMHMIVRNVR